MSAIERLQNKITLTTIPFTDRGSRLLLFKHDDMLQVRLAERWVKHEPLVGHYRTRRPFLEEFVILDSVGLQQPITAVSTYPHAVNIETPVGKFVWTFAGPESLLVSLPEGHFGIRFILHAERTEVDRRGGTTRGRRNAAYTTNARINKHTIVYIEGDRVVIEMHLEAQAGDALLLNLTPRLGLDRAIPPTDVAIEAARTRWQAWFDATPPVLPEYQTHYDYAWWVMRASLFTTRYYFTREAATPSKIHYVGVWLWDQYFHALAYRHVDTRLAEDQLRIFIDHQQPNGMLPDAIHDEGLVIYLDIPIPGDVTKPPIMAWSAMKIYEKSGNLDFLNEIYEPLTNWQGWWLHQNMNDVGLAEYRHPFSSGLDDSPLFDEGLPVVSPDLNTYLVIQTENLARIADMIGLPEAAARHRRQADTLMQRMQAVLWDEQAGYFHALREGQHRVRAFTPFNLLPLWTGRLSDAQNARLIHHLQSARFWPEWPISTVATDDPMFNPMQMWRGPTWVNINYLFTEALARVGQHDLARKLRRRSLELVMQHDDIYEYYHPHTAERPPKAAPIFGWTAASFIEMAIQETALQTEGDQPKKTRKRKASPA